MNVEFVSKLSASRLRRRDFSLERDGTLAVRDHEFLSFKNLPRQTVLLTNKVVGRHTPMGLLEIQITTLVVTSLGLLGVD